MQFKVLAATALVALATQAQAAIAPGSTGDGELFFVIHDSIAKVSYTLDLGVRMDAFLTAEKTAGMDPTISRTVTGDANWTSFAQQADLTKAGWAVLALDSDGGTAAGKNRLLTTGRLTDVAKVGNTTNSQLSNGIGSTQGDRFFGSINVTGSHLPNTDYATDGSSINYETDSGYAYFGKSGGLTPNLNNNAPFQSTNRINDESAFYLLTRSGSAPGNKVTLDLLDTRMPVTVSFDGARVLVSAVPETSTYALMLAGLGAILFLARRRT